jgi:hypothetical protein
MRPEREATFGGGIMRYILVSWACGVLYCILEAMTNGNPYALNLYRPFKPFMKTTINIPKTFFLYLVSGFAMAGAFLLFYKSLPGHTGIIKGLSFALIYWFLRSFISSLSQWRTYTVSFTTVIYMATSGLVQSLLIGLLLGLTLKN